MALRSNTFLVKINPLDKQNCRLTTRQWRASRTLHRNYRKTCTQLCIIAPSKQHKGALSPCSWLPSGRWPPSVFICMCGCPSMGWPHLWDCIRDMCVFLVSLEALLSQIIDCCQFGAIQAGRSNHPTCWYSLLCLSGWLQHPAVHSSSLQPTVWLWQWPRWQGSVLHQFFLFPVLVLQPTLQRVDRIIHSLRVANWIVPER